MKKLFAALGLAIVANSGCSWGDDGHAAIAEIAQRRLTPVAAQKVAAVLGANAGLAAVSAWADDVRDARPDTAAWHFVNIPLAEASYSAVRDCQPSERGDCILAALSRLQNEIRCAPSPNQRAEALRFAVHFVGDVHQPLHAVDEMRGGNQLNLVWAPKSGPLQATNLHAVWDSLLLSSMAPSWGSLADFLEKDWLLSADAAKTSAQPGSPVDWANESHAIAQQIWKATPPTNRIDDKYSQAMQGLATQQLGRAGIRLATYLNQALASNQCPFVASGAVPALAKSGKLPVKVMIINLFDGEARPWADALHFDQSEMIDVPGLLDLPPSPRFNVDYRKVGCTRDGICQLVTGMGHTNAAASTTAMVFSGLFDLSQTYFLITGIAGIDPNVGTVGSATWARFLVDFGIAHEIDPREAPQDWQAGYFGIRTDTKKPLEKPPLRYRTEVYQLDENLLQQALKVSSSLTLEDSPTTVAYRALYQEAAAREKPSVMQCDTATGDTYWHGRILGEHATRWVGLLTDGRGRYCTTQQEDNAVMEALVRGHTAGLLDRRRVAVLRTAANFDRPHPAQTAYESLTGRASGGFEPATKNMVKVGMPLVRTIVDGWAQWSADIPAP